MVAGHVGTPSGAKGALFPLQRAAPGDVITLADTNRRSQKFVVDSVTSQLRTQPLDATLFAQGPSATPLRLVVLTSTDATSYGGGSVTYVSHWIVTATAV